MMASFSLATVDAECGRDQHVLQVPQRRRRGQRLDVEHVQAAPPRRPEASASISAGSSITCPRATFTTIAPAGAARRCVAAQQAGGLVGQRDGKHQHVGARQHRRRARRCSTTRRDAGHVVRAPGPTDADDVERRRRRAAGTVSPARCQPSPTTTAGGRGRSGGVALPAVCRLLRAAGAARPWRSQHAGQRELGQRHGVDPGGRGEGDDRCGPDRYARRSRRSRRWSPAPSAAAGPRSAMAGRVAPVEVEADVGRGQHRRPARGRASSRSGGVPPCSQG